MKKRYIIIALMLLSLGAAVYGCASKEASGQLAIEKSQAMATIQQKVSYLTGQAKAFINSKQYNDAVATAGYILNNLDSNSAEARSLLDKAKAAIATQASKAASDVKSKFGL